MLIPNFTYATAVAVGDRHSIALKGSTLYGWGANSKGQLGGRDLSAASTPREAQQWGGNVSANASYTLSTARQSGGINANNQPDWTPIGVPNAVAVAAGRDHALALNGDGTVWAWGSNESGQLGDGTQTGRTSPVQVSGLSRVLDVAAGDRFSLALKEDGTVWAWGSNSVGPTAAAKPYGPPPCQCPV